MCAKCMPVYVRKRHPIPRNCSYILLWAFMWVVGTEPGFFVRVSSTLSCWAISPGPWLFFKSSVLNMKHISTEELILYQAHNVTARMLLNNTFISYNSQDTIAEKESSFMALFHLPIQPFDYIWWSSIYNTNHIRSLWKLFDYVLIEQGMHVP